MGYSVNFLITETLEFMDAVRTNRQLTPSQKTELLKHLREINNILESVPNRTNDDIGSFLNSIARDLDNDSEDSDDYTSSYDGCGSSSGSGCGSSYHHYSSGCGGSGSHC